MALKVANNASSTLANSINSSVVSINLAGGTGSLFPTLTAGDWFYGTLVDASNDIEVVKVTARSTDALTVVRAQDGTTGKSYSVGDRFELRPTAALFNDKADKDNPSFTTKITTPAITLGATAITATGTELNYVDGVTGAIQTQLNALAPIASPTFSGTATMPTAAVSGNATIGGTLGVTGATSFTVGPTAPTAAVNTNTTQLATTAFVMAQRKLGPAFGAFNTSSQSLVSNTDSKINLGSEDFDSDSTFASSRFTPNVAGYYQINWMVNIAGSSITECYSAIYKNGSEYVRGGQLNIGSGSGVSVFGSTGAQVIFFNGSTDYVELWQHSFGSSLTAPLSKFSGAYFRAT
jgi:hypothetical protein